ncbi:hypothetical protein DH2020_015190 [Rehmannia glutinosa]|uniref:Uncharacterized protein n=1 Tax=Rehmannia glutinosa TaxID=99300 RepID=A0ABR0WZA0_REHGL
MLVAQSPISSIELVQLPKSSRKPLQPKNTSPDIPFSSSSSTNAKPKPSPAAERIIEVSQVDNTNKENVPPFYSTPVKKQSFQIESFDASLAEELSAIRKKLERLGIDKDKTEEMLRERSLMLDLQIKEILCRWELQKQLEIEVDRLYRLKEIKLSCMRTSPLRSLRDKEHEKKMEKDRLKASAIMA